MFLIPQITEKQKWIKIDCNYGTDCVPLDTFDKWLDDLSSHNIIYIKIKINKIEN